MAAEAQRQKDEETQASRRDLGKLRRGLRTPEAAYYRPILQALSQMGKRNCSTSAFCLRIPAAIIRLCVHDKRLFYRDISILKPMN